MSVRAGLGVGSVAVRCTARTPELLPRYATEGAAGADLLADIRESIVLAPGERRLIGTGVRLEIPPGYEGQVRPRSGLALRHGITLVNSPGTVDSDYRGEIAVILANLGSETFEVTPGARIAQIVVAPIARAAFQPTADLGASGRGEGGFGSTGR